MLYFRHKTGVTKAGKHVYKIIDKKENVVKDKKVLNYITKLVIPPAYDKVTIFYEKTPKILFEGFDAKGRKQQIYSAHHKAKAVKKKFRDLLEFGKVLPQIIRAINKGMTAKTCTKNKLISIILKVIISCGFRVGNLKYQKLYGSFGISNIFKKHIVVQGKTLVITFVGKKGVVNHCIVADQALIAQLHELIADKKPGDYVFECISAKDAKPGVIRAIDVNKWLKAYHPSITSKMFRTWDTNVLFIEYMRGGDDPVKMTHTARKKKVVAAMKVVSCQINNTPAIAKKEYLHGDLFEMFIEHPKKYKRLFCNCSNAAQCFIKYLTTLI
jgi:DNA topoisomerase-1